MAEGGNSRGLRSRSLDVMGARKNRRARGRHARLGNSRVIAREFPLPLPFRPPPIHALATKLEMRNWCVGVGLGVEVFDPQALRVGRFFL